MKGNRIEISCPNGGQGDRPSRYGCPDVYYEEPRLSDQIFSFCFESIVKTISRWTDRLGIEIYVALAVVAVSVMAWLFGFCARRREPQTIPQGSPLGTSLGGGKILASSPGVDRDQAPQPPRETQSTASQPEATRTASVATTVNSNYGRTLRQRRRVVERFGEHSALVSHLQSHKFEWGRGEQSIRDLGDNLQPPAESSARLSSLFPLSGEDISGIAQSPGGAVDQFANHEMRTASSTLECGDAFLDGGSASGVGSMTHALASFIDYSSDNIPINENGTEFPHNSPILSPRTEI